MAVGTVSKALLTEIANAIREQNGQQVRYMPLEMSSRVLEMDGTREGVGLVAAPEAGTGVLSEVVFELLADAIRTQNGSTTTYTPPRCLRRSARSHGTRGSRCARCCSLTGRSS